MIQNLLTTPVTILFIINGLIHLKQSIDLKKRFPKEHNLKTSIATFILWVIAGLMYPIIYPHGKENLILQAIANMIIVFIIPISIIILFYLQNAYIKKKPWLMNNRSFDNFIRRFKENEIKLKSLGKDLNRKAMHFIPPALILLLWFSTRNYNKDLGISLIIIIGYSGVILISSFDFVMHTFIYGKKRINHLLPDRITNILTKSMKKQELYEQFKTVPLVLGLLPSLFFPFSIFLSTTLIASLSDGAASVFGNLFGKKHFPKNSKKTIIGYIAGATASFIFVIITCTLLEPTWKLINIIMLGLTGMITFLSIDLFNTKIDDNVLNPLITSLTLGIAYSILIS